MSFCDFNNCHRMQFKEWMQQESFFLMSIYIFLASWHSGKMMAQILKWNLYQSERQVDDFSWDPMEWEHRQFVTTNVLACLAENVAFGSQLVLTLTDIRIHTHTYKKSFFCSSNQRKKLKIKKNCFKSKLFHLLDLLLSRQKNLSRKWKKAYPLSLQFLKLFS